ncbi:2-hydroxy-6-oxo-2,4-heptadienoate hydrolase-like isoform X2 [Salvia splendens]|uniref:2-hydroxy-6-oxo-2,4-heptadienoate hydrolase-like isoform X2 n=1 Tax=Salvia splendens TaxID=180675 RepID=UPI001C2716C5|nr:2-hydroxy-6-oxo-2,4-heptadienoate hydrolase-like isoform X2 [Salvia splendens]
MGKCFSFTSSRDKCYRWSFSSAGLRSLTANLGDGTFIHSWGPKAHKPNKPTLVLLHGIGANAMWQWGDFVSPLSAKFNVYVPDLLFFGDSYTSRPERGEGFQAECVYRALAAAGVRGRMSVVGLSYGGFVAYSMAARFPEAVERVVIGCAGVCLEERDMEEGMFKVMCTENLQERKELIYALHKDRKLSDLPKITQPTLIIWGEHDQVFPVELAHRLVRHLGNNAELVILKNAGHAINMEKTKELYKLLKSFLIPKLENNGKVD